MMRKVLPAAISSVCAVMMTMSMANAGSGHKHGHKHKHTELGAHQHGHGKLNVALEKGVLQIELEAPANDIVGFESKANTDKKKKAIKSASKTLSDPVTLFGIPSAAGCTKKSGDVEHHVEGDHAEFHVEMTLNCKDPKALDRLNLAYFKSFPGAKELDVKMIVAGKQKATELEPKSAVLKLR